MEFPMGNNAGGKRVRGAEVLAPRRRGRRHEFDDPEDDEDEEEEEGDDAPPVHDPLMPVSKRGQQSATEAALADALRAEARAKAARQQHKEAETKEAKKSDKSKKVSFAAQEEGDDTVCAAETKEAQKAAAARAVRRKGAKDIGGTDFDEDLAVAEERGAVGRGGGAGPAEDEGELEPFNLDAERETGFFDEDGNYVFQKEEKHEEDAWLEGVEVDEKMAEKVRREAEAEATKPVHVSDAELGKMQMEIADMLLPDETVLRALKRMSGKPAAGAGRGRGAATPGRATAASASHMDPAQRAAFERLTELSSTLMAFGEYDVYTFTKEGFLRSARALCAPVPATAAPASARGAATSMDMFADDDDVKPPPAKRQATAEARVTAGNAPASSPPDFSSWSVAQVRRFLDVRGQTAAATGAVEKGDLIALARDTASTAGLQIPAGYAWDAASGLYMSAESGLSYDIATCAFGDSSGQWYLWDATTNKFVPWTTGSL